MVHSLMILFFLSFKDSVFGRSIPTRKAGQRMVLQAMWNKRTEPPVSQS